MAQKHRRRKNSSGKSVLSKPTAPRNPYFNHPLMGKSHQHDKSYKSVRSTAKVKLRNSYRSENRYDGENIMQRLQGVFTIAPICDENRALWKLACLLK